MPDKDLFDLVIPPGVPRSILFNIEKKFDLKVVKRKVPLTFAAMEGDVRELLAFRGEKEVVEAAEAYLNEQLKIYIGGGEIQREDRQPEKSQ